MTFVNNRNLGVIVDKSISRVANLSNKVAYDAQNVFQDSQNLPIKRYPDRYPFISTFPDPTLNTGVLSPYMKKISIQVEASQRSVNYKIDR